MRLFICRCLTRNRELIENHLAFLSPALMASPPHPPSLHLLSPLDSTALHHFVRIRCVPLLVSLFRKLCMLFPSHSSSIFCLLYSLPSTLPHFNNLFPSLHSLSPPFTPIFSRSLSISQPILPLPRSVSPAG